MQKSQAWEDMNTGVAVGAPSSAHTYAFRPGDRLGQYTVVRLLGAGGMGEVYEVEHRTLELRYALKLLPDTLDWHGVTLERFRREAKVMAKLDHPNILKVDDFGETDQRYWLRMELAEGVAGCAGCEKPVVSLQNLADAYGGKVPPSVWLPILRQILEGLQYAHARGVIHRDLKPANILLTEDAGKIRAKIADFGLVRLVGEDWVRSQAELSVQRSLSMSDQPTVAGVPGGAGEGTSTRALLGTFEYMSPEQKRGGEADARSDLYAVGLMTYRLLTGRNLGMKTPSQIDPTLARGWDVFVAAALEEEWAERMPDAASGLKMLAAVERTSTPPSVTKPLSVPEVPPPLPVAAPAPSAPPKSIRQPVPVKNWHSTVLSVIAVGVLWGIGATLAEEVHGPMPIFIAYALSPLALRRTLRLRYAEWRH